MTKIPSKVQSRLVAGIKKFQPILAEAKARGINDRARSVNESDTVIIIIEMLSEIFGYDKFTELTSEKEIRGTYCDLATVIEQKVQTLIEAKAINQALKDSYVNQAVAYATNKGVEWVLLTNGVTWQVYKVVFSQPIDHELILEIDFLVLNPHDETDLGKLFLLTKESWPNSALKDYYSQKKALNKYSISAVIQSDPVLNVIRHELRQIYSDVNVKIDVDEIRTIFKSEVVRPGLLENEKSEEARKSVARAANKVRKNKMDKESAEGTAMTGERPPAVSVIPASPPPAPLPSAS